MRGARRDEVEQKKKVKNTALRDEHHARSNQVGLRDLDEGHQVHALVLGLVHQRPDPALVVAHAAQAVQVDQRRADHAGHRGDGLQHDRAVAVALGEEGVGEEAQAAVMPKATRSDQSRVAWWTSRTMSAGV